MTAEAINIEDYLPLLRGIATKMSLKLPRCVELDDLVQWGYFGLRDAARTFDPSLNVKFSSHAMFRIRGAILDGIRDYDWVPRLVRSRKEAVVSQKSISSLLFDDGSKPVTLRDSITDETVEIPGDRLEKRELADRIIRFAPSKCRRIIELYYVEDKTMKQVGEILAMSESRVSQLHDWAIRKIKRKIHKLGLEE